MEERFRWTLRVNATEQGTVRVAARKNLFEVGAPFDFDEEADHVSALEYCLGALGAELVGGIKRRAESQRMDVEHVEAVVHGELNDSLAAIGVVGAKGHPGIERITVGVYVSSSETEAELERLWREVQETSPLLRTLQVATRVEVTFQVAL